MASSTARAAEPEISIVQHVAGTPVPAHSVVDMGTEQTGRSKSTTFRVQNLGDANLVVSDTQVTGTCFSRVGSATATVEPGEYTTFQVRFQCADPGEYSGGVHVYSNDPRTVGGATHKYSFLVQATAVEPPELGVVSLWNGTEVTAGETVALPATVGTESQHSFRLENRGGLTLWIDNPGSTVDGACFSQEVALPAYLNPGQAVDLEVRITCASVGTHNGSIHVTSSSTSPNSFNFNLTTSIVAPTRASAVEFSTAGSWIDVIDAGNLQVDDAITLEAWVRPTAGSGIRHIISKESEFLLGLGEAHTVRWALGTATPGWTWIDTGASIDDDLWNHVALVYDGAIATTFINGQEVHQRPVSGTLTAGAYPLRVGARGLANTNSFSGEIDEVRVWNVARSPADIVEYLHTSPSANATGLAARFSFDEGQGEVAGDSGTNGLVGTLVGQTNWTKSDRGPYGTVDLRGQGSFLKASALHVTHTLTLEAWVRPDQGSSGLIAGQVGEYHLSLGPDYKLRWALNNQSPGWTLFGTGAQLEPETWNHVALTYDHGAIRTYVDGVLVHSGNGAGPIVPQNPAKAFRIGEGDGSGLGAFRGQIDEVRVWNVARTADQIATDRNARLIGSEPGLIGLWTFDGANQTADRSGLGRNLTPVGDAVIVGENRGRPERSLSVDGDGDWVDVGTPDDLHLDSSLSLEAWVKPASGSGAGTILGKENEYLVGLSAQHTIRWALRLTDPGWTWVDTGVQIPDDEWSHLAVTYDGSTVTTIVNGVVTHAQAAAGAIPSREHAFRIAGRYWGTGEPFSGQIDEVRVWNRARSAGEIADDMNAPSIGSEVGLVGYWNFDDDSVFAWEITSTGNHGVQVGNANTIEIVTEDQDPPPPTADPTYAYSWDAEAYLDEPAVWWTLDDSMSPSELQAELQDRFANRQRYLAAAGGPVTADQLFDVQVFIDGSRDPELVPMWLAFSKLATNPSRLIASRLSELGMDAAVIDEIYAHLDQYRTRAEELENELYESKYLMWSAWNAAAALVGRDAVNAAIDAGDFSRFDSDLGMIAPIVQDLVREGRRDEHLEAAVEGLLALSDMLDEKSWHDFRSFLRTDIAPRVSAFSAGGIKGGADFPNVTVTEDLGRGVVNVFAEVTGLATLTRLPKGGISLQCVILSESEEARRGRPFPRSTNWEGPGFQDTSYTSQQIERFFGRPTELVPLLLKFTGRPSSGGLGGACTTQIAVPMCWGDDEQRDNRWWAAGRMLEIHGFFTNTPIGDVVPYSRFGGPIVVPCEQLYEIRGRVKSSGSVSGRVGVQLALLNDEGEVIEDMLSNVLSVRPGDEFTFGLFRTGTRYRALFRQPVENPGVSCTVDKATGTVLHEDVSDILLDCTFPEGGTRLGGRVANMPPTVQPILIGAEIRGGDPEEVFVVTSPPIDRNGLWYFDNTLTAGYRWNDATVVGQPQPLRGGATAECFVANGESGVVAPAGDQLAIDVECKVNAPPCTGRNCPCTGEECEEVCEGPDCTIVDDPRLPQGTGASSSQRCTPRVDTETVCVSENNGPLDCDVRVRLIPCGKAATGTVNSPPELSGTLRLPNRHGDDLLTNDWIGVELAAWDPDGIDGFLVAIDGATVADWFEVPQQTAQAAWPELQLGSLAEGEHTLALVAIDAHSSEATYSAMLVPFTVDHEVAPIQCPRPTVNISSPRARDVLSGAVEVGVESSTALGAIELLELRVDGQTLDTADGVDSMVFTWDTAGWAFGDHELMAVARNDCGESKATVPLAVTVDNRINHNPIAQDDHVTVLAGESVLIEVTANDIDPDGDQVVLTGPATFLPVPPSSGSATKEGPNHIRYVPQDGLYGADSFQYQVGDNRGKRDWATVTVEVALPEARFNPSADAWVNGSASYEDQNYGFEPWLRLRTSAGGHGRHTYLKFDVSGVYGDVHSAKLRVRARANPIPSLGAWAIPAVSWPEGALTWLNAPIAGAQLITRSGPIAAGEWHEIDVTDFISGSGTYTIAIATDLDMGGLTIHSRESDSPAELVVTYEP